MVVAEFLKGEKSPKIIGTGSSISKGIRKGYVFKFEDAVKSIKKAVADAEVSSGIKIKTAYVSIGGITLSSQICLGSAVISRSDSEVTSLDITKAIKESEKNLNLGNKKVIHIFPISYKLDDKEVIGRPEGQHGLKLEVRTLFVTISSQHLDDLLGAIAEAGVEPINEIASPLAAAEVALTERQKMVGCALINIGGETLSMAVFEDGTPIYVHAFSIGSTDITNDIALGLKTSLEEAEGLKLGSITGSYPKKKLDEIIEARFGDMFELIENHFKKIKRSELLPAGLIFIGGGSAHASLENLSKKTMNLPSRVGASEMFGNTKTKLRDPAWFTALGLCLYSESSSSIGTSDDLPGLFKDLRNGLKSMFKQLKP